MKYSKEIRKFIQDNVAGKRLSELTALINSTFDTDCTESQIKSYKANNKLTSGVDCRFAKGSIPPNKGKKGTCPAGCEKGWFKKGNSPKNRLKVGTERLREDGYIWIKIGGPDRWRQKHRLLWEEANGPIPKGGIILFADSDRSNITIDNLILISKSQLLTLNRNGLIQNKRELTEVGVLIADVISLANSKKRGGA